MPTVNSVRIPSIIHNSEDSQEVIPGYHGRVHCRRQLSEQTIHFGEWEPSQGGNVGGSLAYPAAALIHTSPAGSAAAGTAALGSSKPHIFSMDKYRRNQLSP